MSTMNMSGKEYAKYLSGIGIGSKRFRSAMRFFWINWDNESEEWQKDFVKSAPTNLLVYIMNHII